MELPILDPAPGWDSRAEFPDTEWSVILALNRSEEGPGAEGLERLCRAYLAPVYAYLRVALNLPVPDAQDLASEFVARLGQVSRRLADRENPRAVRFRDFLRRCVRNYALQVRERGLAGRRGGGKALVSFEDNATWLREELATEAPDEADRVFDREWAATVVARARAAVAERYRSSGAWDEWEMYHSLLTEPVAEAAHASFAARAGITVDASKKRLERLRRRFRHQLRSAVAGTLCHPSDIDDELRYLVRVWLARGTPQDVNPSSS